MNIKKYQAQYYLDNCEKIRKYKKRWYSENRKDILKKTNQYYTDNYEKSLELREQWRKNHPEYYKQYYKDNPEKQAMIGRRQRFKRRGLGFFALNEFFEGSEGHHISQNFVIYIPKEIHRSISHNVWTGKNMEQMNKLAIEFL